MPINQNNSFVYVKGEFVHEDKAVISVKERGFLFGDGVFETMRIENGVIYAKDLHQLRLKQGLESLMIEANLGKVWQAADELIKKNNLDKGLLRVSVSRGIGSSGYLPDENIESTIIIETMNVQDFSDEAVDLYLSSIRKIPLECLPVQNKTMQGLNSTLARMEAQNNNCFESLMLNIKGEICEASSANIFIVKDNVIYTPPLTSGVLNGTIRNIIFNISPLKVKEKILSIKDVESADEVFLTNVAYLVMPVKSLKPLEFMWQSFAVAGEIKQQIELDMRKSCVKK